MDVNHILPNPMKSRIDSSTLCYLNKGIFPLRIVDFWEKLLCKMQRYFLHRIHWRSGFRSSFGSQVVEVIFPLC
jgi:hypothetical protein